MSEYATSTRNSPAPDAMRRIAAAHAKALKAKALGASQGQKGGADDAGNPVTA